MIDGIIEDGFARESNRNLFTVAETLDEVFEQLEAEPAPKFDPREKLL
jgi:hypothetical protein